MIRFSRLPIRIQLISLAILLTLPAVGIIVYSGLKERAQNYHTAEIESQKLADNLAAEQEGLVHEAKQLCRILAELPDIKNRNVSKIQPILSSVLSGNKQYLKIILADANGTVWGASSPFTSGESVSDRRYFKNARATLQYSSGEYALGKTSKKPTLHMAYPILGKHSEFQGNVIVGFDLDVLRSVLERSQLPKNANYIIADHKGIIICRGRSLGRDVGEPIQPADLKKMEDGPERNTYEFVRSDGERRIVTYRKLRLDGEQTPYAYVRAGISIREAVAAANRKLFFNMAMLMPFAVVAFLLAVFIGKRSIVDRVAQLQAASKQIIEGDLLTRVAPLVEGGELGELGQAFDDMAQTLDDKINKLMQAQQDLRIKASKLEEEVADRRLAQESLAIKQGQLEALNMTLEERVGNAVEELRQKDQALIQQNRLASMGEMIGNIAHQWRHPLHNIGMIVQLFPAEFGDLSEAKLEQRVDQIMDIIMQMSQTIDDFTNFFHKDKEKTLFTAHNAVFKAIGFNRPSLENKDINISVEGDQDVNIFGYSNEYQQVLLNIISNAKDALVQKNVKEPLISIRIERINEHSVVTISDNGGGIDESILTKIFDPYFTTKGPSLGTGIGLYMSKMIIEQNMGGHLEARNVADGAEFRIEV
ncbi:MAG: HAMP domain-containing protein [Desulfuromonadales bacterium]|nr:HAMP domain-containing protein [Desulfuromonadales bacterium]